MYEVFLQSLRDQGCQGDAYEDLEGMDQIAWDAVAAAVEARRPLSVAEAGA